MGFFAALLFFLSLLPIIYVGLFNYATGDDYWYSINTHAGFVEEGIWGALKGSFLTVAEFYEGWQGTWFTIFLFSLSPNNFAQNGYVIVVFLTLSLLIGSVVCLANHYLVKLLKLTRGAVAVIVCMVLYLAFQYMPRGTSGIYWFNGIMHYLVPFFVGAVAIVYTQKFVDRKRKRDYFVLFLCFTLLGGGSYLVPVSASLAACLILVSKLEIKEGSLKQKKLVLAYDWRNLWVLAALAAEAAGLFISFMSPGNSVRGGEEFGFSLKWALDCVFQAIDRGIYLGEDYFLKNPVNTIVYLMLAVILWQQMWRVDKERFRFKNPLLFVIYTNGIYWASYMPEIYARSDVSGGVPNTYFHIFLLVTLANMVYVHGWIQRKLWERWKKTAQEQGVDTMDYVQNKLLYPERFRYCCCFPLLLAGILVWLAADSFSEVKTVNAYCREAVESGQLKEYAKVRSKQHHILMDEGIQEAVVPEMEAPYPLLNMTLSEEEGNSRNQDRAVYYQKKSVKAYRVD